MKMSHQIYMFSQWTRKNSIPDFWPGVRFCQVAKSFVLFWTAFSFSLLEPRMAFLFVPFFFFIFSKRHRQISEQNF